MFRELLLEFVKYYMTCLITTLIRCRFPAVQMLWDAKTDTSITKPKVKAMGSDVLSRMPPFEGGDGILMGCYMSLTFLGLRLDITQNTLP